ncbi:MAG TPA: type VI secretion system tube protein Hcp, partial [Actinomycetes bacterium]|nr:type VI secretion system tube protein Hcp [Actinomycetes bacterium]
MTPADRRALHSRSWRHPTPPTRAAPHRGRSATAAGHRDEIDLVTLHRCVTNQTDPGGGGGGAGKAVFDGVVIGKHTDLATVPLVEAAATG